MGLFDRLRVGRAKRDNRDETVVAPVDGRVARMRDIPDPVFSGGMMGQAVGIWPEAGEVGAPVTGTVVAAMPHALGLTTRAGNDVIVHIGVDTVEMGGDGFEVLVRKGDAVAAGTPLVRFDRKKVAQANHPDVVIVAVSNTQDIQDAGGSVRDMAPEAVFRGEAILKIVRG